MEITVYSTGCPQCNVLKKKLDQKGINYTLIEDKDQVVSAATEYNIMSVPFVIADGSLLNFSSAIELINNM